MQIERREDGELRFTRADTPEHEEYSYRRPFILELELTRRCNLRCRHCSTEAPGDGAGELTFEEIRDLLEDARDIGIPELSLSGGEATLHPRFLDVVDLALDLGRNVRFVTNGTTATPDLVSSLAERPLSLITVSLDAVDPEVHEAIRGPGSHRPAIEGLERMVEAGLPLSVITAFCKLNLDQFAPLRDLCTEWGIDWQVQMTSAKGRCPSELTLSPDEYYALGEQVVEVLLRGSPTIIPMDDLATFSRFSPLRLLAETWQGRCTGGLLNIFVRANGAVTPCSALALDSAVVGDLRRDRLSAICLEERCRHHLAWLDVARLKGTCARCPYNDRCFGGCPDILGTMCRSPDENEYCYYRIEESRLLSGLGGE